MSEHAHPPSGELDLHVLTLTPFYPTTNDDAAGCFVSEPLDALDKAGVRNTVIAGTGHVPLPTARKRPRTRPLVIPNGPWRLSPAG